MRPAGIGSRLGGFALALALAAAAAPAFFRGAPSAAPSNEELAVLERELRARARLHPVAPKLAPGGAAPFCSGCHPSPPHPGGTIAAAMRNEHASRMDCLLCHWPATAGPRPTPSWQVPAGSPVFLSVLPPERASREQLERLRAAAIATQRCLDRGPACGDCHRPGGMGAFARPGTVPGRGAALERLERYFSLAPGEKWYLPQLQ